MHSLYVDRSTRVLPDYFQLDACHLHLILTFNRGFAKASDVIRVTYGYSERVCLNTHHRQGILRTEVDNSKNIKPS